VRDTEEERERERDAEVEKIDSFNIKIICMYEP